MEGKQDHNDRWGNTPKRVVNGRVFVINPYQPYKYCGYRVCNENSGEDPFDLP